MLLMISLFLSLIFLFLNHPMTMGMTLLIQTICISLITGMLNLNFWYSYILFMIMIGGLLVLFIYITSIASNEMFNYSNKILYMSTIFFSISMMIIIIIDNYFTFYNQYILESTIIIHNNINLNKFFNYPSMLLILFMIISLFLTLIAIVKITKIEYGPLRKKFSWKYL